MGEQRRYKVTDDRFGRLAFTLRERAGLTQTEVAQVIGVSERTIQHWESGTAFPGVANLKQLVALFLQRRVFSQGRERDEAEALWAQADESAARRRSLFDADWFDTLLAQPGVSSTPPQVPATATTPPSPAPPRRVDWGEAPDISTFCGREQELTTLTHWVVADRCRVVVLLGIGGMGKTTLAIRVAQLVTPHFVSVCWRSLRDAPTLEALLTECIQSLTGQTPLVAPQSAEQGIAMLLERLREGRCLLVLDNVETILEAGGLAGRYREEHAKYRLLFQRLAETPHQSSVILTSRELLSELEPLEGAHRPVRALRLGGLERTASLELLKDNVLFGPPEAWDRFAQHYAGNPLALKIAAATVRDLFGGDLTAYLSDIAMTLVSLHELLTNQFERLTAIERGLLTWLAVEREGATIEQLVADIYPPISRKDVLVALKSLRQRSLIERSEPGVAFTLLSVVMEYVSDLLVTQMVEEIAHGAFGLLSRYALMKAHSADYIRDSQQRMLLQPALALLQTRFGDQKRLAAHLRGMLERLRAVAHPDQGYAGGNLVNLLVALQGHLRGENCGDLVVRQAYVIGVEAQDASFVNADVSEARFTEPLAAIASMALSPDGRYLAVGSFSGQIRLWQVADGRPLWSASGHPHTTFALAFNAEGTRLISGGDQGTLRLWDSATGRCLLTVQTEHGWIYSLAISPDGSTLVSSGDEGVVRVWRLADGTSDHILHGHRARVWSLTFSPNGALLITSGSDGTVRIWDTQTWSCLRVLAHGTENVTVKSTVHPAGLVIASCGEEDGLIKLWGVHSGDCLAVAPRHTPGPASIALNPAGTLLVTGSSTGMLEMWGVGGAAELTYQKMVHGHRKFVNTVAFAEHDLLASASYGGRVRLWDARGGKLLKTFQGHSRLVSALDFHPSSDRLAVGDSNGVVQLWDAQSGQCLRSSQGHSGPVWGIAVSSDGALFATGGDDRQLCLWDGQSGERLTAVRAHTAAVQALAFSPTEKLMVSGGGDREIRLWRIEELNAPPASTTLAVGPDWVTALAFAPDGRSVASGHINGEIRIWDIARGICLQKVQRAGSITSLRFNRDGRTLVGSGNETLGWWEVASGQCIKEVAPEELPGRAVLTALGEEAAVRVISGVDDTMQLWRITEQGEPQFRASIPERTTWAWGVALSWDQHLLALSADEGSVALYDCSSGAILHRLVNDRPYERMRIDGATGLNDEQRAALQALGATDDYT